MMLEDFEIIGGKQKAVVFQNIRSFPQDKARTSIESYQVLRM